MKSLKIVLIILRNIALQWLTIFGFCGIALLFVLLASCAHPNQPSPPQSEPVGLDTSPVDTTRDREFVRINSANPLENGPARQIVVEPHRTILDKVLGRKPAPVTYTGGAPFRAGKKSTITINHIAGSQTNNANTAGKNAVAGAGATGGKADGPVAGTGAGLVNIEKAKAPVSTGTGDATDQAGAGTASTIKGNNNAPVLTNTEQKAPGIGATIAGAIATPVGKVIGLVLLAGAVYGVYRLWPVLRRKNTSTPNQA